MVLKKIVIQARRMTIAKMLLVKDESVKQMMSRKKLSIMRKDDCIAFLLNSKHFFAKKDDTISETFIAESEKLTRILNRLRTKKIKFKKEQLKEEKRQKRIQKMQD